MTTNHELTEMKKQTQQLVEVNRSLKTFVREFQRFNAAFVGFAKLLEGFEEPQVDPAQGELFPTNEHPSDD
jgi:hypothetical protein